MVPAHSGNRKTPWDSREYIYKKNLRSLWKNSAGVSWETRKKAGVVGQAVPEYLNPEGSSKINL